MRQHWHALAGSSFMAVFFLGCGRYVGGHSHAHFLETGHSYTMELGQSRVWDYVGDNFVHRLVQTDSADGKLVEAEGMYP